jgi:hypothetical protein
MKTREKKIGNKGLVMALVDMYYDWVEEREEKKLRRFIENYGRVIKWDIRGLRIFKRIPEIWN